jgi:2-(1,2-epoxy-1,2-dihydrophenyl)acetyl-CoA isomerase
VAEKYAHIAPLAFELLKDTLAEGLDEVLKAEIDMQPILMLSEDHEEGKRAFFEKRRPKFTGR